MATSGTTSFNPDFTEIAEEAWERAGREMRSGYDLRTARRSMNLLTIEWQNRGINLWTIDQGSVTLVEGTSAYDLPCLMAGLAYYIAQKDPELAPRIGMLKEIYEEQFNLAAGEDREKTSARFVPRIGYV